jgi:L-rhamnose-H+ transport protein
MNPVVGVLFHWLGGLASGSFYVPFRRVRNWSWETYWLVGGFFSWIVAPWLLASLLTHDLWHVLSQQSASTMGWTYLFGALWGLGGLTFGLAMRYLGMSLGMGIALGYCAAFGTLVPPIAKSLMPSIAEKVSLDDLLNSHAGQIKLFGVAVCLLGIAMAAFAGFAKEREMPEEEKRKSIREFNFPRGVAVASFSGIMSACFAFALSAGRPIAAASIAAGTTPIWSGLPKLVVVLLGGFTTNSIWCALLNWRNRSGYEYLARRLRGVTHDRHNESILESPLDAPSEEMAQQASSGSSANYGGDIPLLTNYLFSALAGTTWYMQFFFYTMGENKMGDSSKFASWTLHMASIIIFSTLWGWYFREWTGASRQIHRWITAGIATLVLSTLIIGWGAWLETPTSSSQANVWPRSAAATSGDVFADSGP